MIYDIPNLKVVKLGEIKFKIESINFLFYGKKLASKKLNDSTTIENLTFIYKRDTIASEIIK